MSVVFSRAPLRISLGGGGTDLPSYYSEHGGFLVAGAIDKYIYMLIHTVFQRRYRMKYSESEEVETIAEIRHPILRETLSRHWRGSPLEIASSPTCRPAPAWARLAHSRSRCSRVSLTRADLGHPGPIAEPASEIEIDVLKENCGKQDPYVSAHGGMCAYTFHKDGTVEVEPLELSSTTLRALREKMLLFYTGSARESTAVLADQDQRTRGGDAEMLENLHRTKEMGYRSRELLLDGDLFAYAELMHEHWLNKRERSPGMANEPDRRAVHAGPTLGVVGGKLVGAGGGGFLLVYARNPADTRQAMAAAGATELPFDFDFVGAQSSEYV